MCHSSPRLLALVAALLCAHGALSLLPPHPHAGLLLRPRSHAADHGGAHCRQSVSVSSNLLRRERSRRREAATAMALGGGGLLENADWGGFARGVAIFAAFGGGLVPSLLSASDSRAVFYARPPSGRRHGYSGQPV